jgi:hypothetical protein
MMKEIQTCLLLFFLALASSVCYGQQTTITGKVVDAHSGLGVPDVYIIVKGCISGVASDEYGRFSLQVPSGNVQLEFSAIGYKTKMVTPEGQRNILVQMMVDQIRLVALPL